MAQSGARILCVGSNYLYKQKVVRPLVKVRHWLKVCPRVNNYFLLKKTA